ncbi:hypothetical protein UT300005_12950 [Clostridium sp. CTA-5]
MQINNNGIYNNTYNQGINQSNNLSRNNILNSNNSYKDKLELSNESRKVRRQPIMVFGLDKGTASNTTIFVNKGTFNQIANYTTDNPDCQWEEIGCDGVKRWVVVNGQRFECPLSKEERAAYEQASKTIIDYINEEEEKKEKKYSDKESEPINFEFNVDGSISIGDESLLSSNPKISGLLKNEKVMTMLKDIAKLNGGSITMSI